MLCISWHRLASFHHISAYILLVVSVIMYDDLMLTELGEADRLIRSSDADPAKARQSVFFIVFCFTFSWDMDALNNGCITSSSSLLLSSLLVNVQLVTYVGHVPATIRLYAKDKRCHIGTESRHFEDTISAKNV